MIITKQTFYIFFTVFFVTIGLTISYTINVSKTRGCVTESLSRENQIQEHIGSARNYFYNDVNIQAALDEYYRALSLDPNNINALLGLAETYTPLATSVEIKDKTINILRHIISIEPENQKAIKKLLKMLSYSPTDHLKEARTIINKYQETLLMDPEIIIAISKIISETNPWDAINLLESSLDKFPDHAEIHHKLGLFYYQESDLVSATNHLTLARTLLNNYHPSLRNTTLQLNVNYAIELVTVVEETGLQQMR